MSERLTPAEIDAIEKTWRGVGDFDVVHDKEYGDLTLRVEGYGVVARMDCDDEGFVKTAEAWAQGGSTVRALVAAVRELDAATTDTLTRERDAALADAARLRAAAGEVLATGDGIVAAGWEGVSYARHCNARDALRAAIGGER